MEQICEAAAEGDLEIAGFDPGDIVKVVERDGNGIFGELVREYNEHVELKVIINKQFVKKILPVQRPVTRNGVEDG